MPLLVALRCRCMLCKYSAFTLSFVWGRIADKKHMDIMHAFILHARLAVRCVLYGYNYYIRDVVYYPEYMYTKNMYAISGRAITKSSLCVCRGRE
jgi:hypothetical protein